MNMADPATLIASWFTPSSLFILVNLVIGTIALTTRLTAPKPQNHHHQLHRSPSLLDRVRSFNLRNYDPTQPESAHPELDRVGSFKFSLYKSHSAPPETEYIQPEPETLQPDPVERKLVRAPSLLERVRSMSFSRLHRAEEGSDPGRGDSGDAEMKESASERVERRRPATATARIETTSCGEDEEVDAKADDFINRFKKQLKLQRMDSILRYREILRGN